MARGCYGYGSWTAPYWFIGPEQGMQAAGDLDKRVNAWVSLGRGELDDCLEFHKLIEEPRWHGKSPKLQKTWKQLMLMLMSFLGNQLDINKASDKASLCAYQRDHLGRSNDETCLLELSGLPAHSYTTSKKQRSEIFKPSEFAEIRKDRIALIRARILQHMPKLIVMYGHSEIQYWKEIASVEAEFPIGFTPPLMAFPTHPVSFEGVRNSYWEDMGAELRKKLSE